MELTPLGFVGVIGIKSTASFDERGSFLRVWEEENLKNEVRLKQASAAINPRPRTLRGLHYQENPHAETKIVQCVLGSVFDVVVDLREDSPTYGKYLSTRIGPVQEYQGIVVPKGFAHGYLTLEENSTLLYYMDHSYVPGSARGIAWDDPAFQIDWPYKPDVISAKDKNFPHVSAI